MTPRVAIIGAGLAGLTAAHRLLTRPSPPEVVVIDKGRHGGGRLCTRTVELPDGRKARFDIGPPVLYARYEFRHEPESFRVLGLAGELADDELFTRRQVGRIGESVVDEPISGLTVRGGVRELAFRLLTAHSDRLDFRDHTLAEKLQKTDDGWRIHTRSLRDDHRATVTANALILTPPVPQALGLLAANGIELPDELRYALRKIEYTRCIAVYGLFTEPGRVLPGGEWASGGVFEWVCDNALKDVSPVALSLTGLTTDQWAKDHWHETDARLLERLVPALRPWGGEPAGPDAVWVHKWQWARPVNPVSMPCAVLRDLAAVIAGDGFAAAHREPVD
ncbi:MAG: FAD-dependent oxidoreductase, partial [Gemmataceae bacterium]|nr:FAD-dependent oxidoreductase [Gemmataceae bacterium]